MTVCKKHQVKGELKTNITLFVGYYLLEIKESKTIDFFECKHELTNDLLKEEFSCKFCYSCK